MNQNNGEYSAFDSLLNYLRINYILLKWKLFMIQASMCTQEHHTSLIWQPKITNEQWTVKKNIYI